MRRSSVIAVFVAIVAGQMWFTHPLRAQAGDICAPARPGVERCERRSADGAVEIERAVAAPKKVSALFVRPGRGSERLARRALGKAFAADAVPVLARPILKNALEQCVRSGAEITTRVGPLEWFFLREAPYVCVVRIGLDLRNIRWAMGSRIL